MADDTERPENPLSVKEELWGPPDDAPLEDLAVPPGEVWGPALGSKRSEIAATSWRWAGRGGSPTRSREQQELESSLPPVTNTVEPAPTEFEVLGSHLETVRSSLTSALAALEARLDVGMGALVARVERLETDLEQALRLDGEADGAHRGRPLSMRLTSLGERARTDAARLSEVLVARRSVASDPAISADVLAPLRSDLRRLDEKVQQISDVLFDLQQRLPEPATARKATGTAKRAAPKETGLKKASSARATSKPAISTVSAPRARRPPSDPTPGS